MERILQALEEVVARLRGVPQNPIYHGEGDAEIHTRLVMRRLQENAAWQGLAQEERETLLYAAALHDVGKGEVTRLENGQWTSPNHSIVGEKLARELLVTRFGMSGTEAKLLRREAICGLIRGHMSPIYVLHKKNPDRGVRRMAALGDTAPGFTLEKLALLAESDHLGRVCSDWQEGLDDLKRFRELAIQNSCWQGPFSYPDAGSRYADLSGRKNQAEEPWGTVVMVCGLSEAGRNAWIQRQYAQWPRLSLEEIRRELGAKPMENEDKVIRTAQGRARAYLKRQVPFVCDAANVSELLRRPWIALFHQYGAAVRVLYLETGGDAWAKGLSEADIAGRLRQLEPPTTQEAEEVLWQCV